MLVHELIDLLSQMDPADEIRVATQPEYPLALNLAGVAAPSGERHDLWCHECDGQVAVARWLPEGELEARHVAAWSDGDHAPVLGDDLADDEGLEAGVVWLVADSPAEHPYAPSAVFEAVQGL